MDEARVDPTDIDYVNAHGSGTKQNDRHETAAVKRSLGEHAYRTPMTGIKAIVGHSLGAIGSIELAACALSIQHGVVVPTANLKSLTPSATSTMCRTRPGSDDSTLCSLSAAGSADSRARWY
jgi:act minimal PKS ketosynthase (KS/KS alpha)